MTQQRKEKLEHDYLMTMGGDYETPSDGFDRLSETCPIKTKEEIENFRENFDKFLSSVDLWNEEK